MQDEINVLNDRLESARDQVMNLLLRQRNGGIPHTADFEVDDNGAPILRSSNDVEIDIYSSFTESQRQGTVINLALEELSPVSRSWDSQTINMMQTSFDKIKSMVN